MFRMDMHAGPETALLIHPATKKSSANSCCFNICSRRTQSGGRQYTQYGKRLYASCVTLVMRGRTFRLRRNSAGRPPRRRARRARRAPPAPVYLSKSRKQRACFPFSSVHFSKKARKQITLIVLPLYRQETTALSLPENRPCGSTAYPSLRTYICGSSLAVICFFIPVLLSSCIYRGRVFFCLQFREIWVQSN